MMVDGLSGVPNIARIGSINNAAFRAGADASHCVYITCYVPRVAFRGGDQLATWLCTFQNFGP